MHDKGALAGWMKINRSIKRTGDLEGTGAEGCVPGNRRLSSQRCVSASVYLLWEEVFCMCLSAFLSNANNVPHASGQREGTEGQRRVC